jgi:DNA polymerase III subunit delta'
MASTSLREAPPESDRFPPAPHPRETIDLVGHAQAERALLEAYQSGRLAHAWIIGGREGIGKATLAWRFARFLLVNPDPGARSVQEARSLWAAPDHPAARRVASLSHGDLVLLRREWNDKTKRQFTEIRIDDVRRALDLFRKASGEGGWRICIVDCAEDLNRSSANALLKMVEEPPAKSLFLLISHRPAQVLATLRSRSRMLHLDPLAPNEVVAAIQAAGRPWSERARQDLAAAAARSGGSVREALRHLQEDVLKVAGQLQQILEGLPRLDWRAAQALADSVSGRDKDDAYGAFLGACFDWLDASVRRGGPAVRLASQAAAWEKISKGSRETEALNLDRKAFVLTVLADLAQAAGPAAGG